MEVERLIDREHLGVFCSNGSRKIEPNKGSIKAPTYSVREICAFFRVPP
jgi:hypothetical protein